MEKMGAVPVAIVVIDSFKNHFSKLYGMLRRRGERPDAAEDLVQEAFVRLLT